jgi:hypothetical protein
MRGVTPCLIDNRISCLSLKKGRQRSNWGKLEENSFRAWYKPSPFDSATRVGYGRGFWSAFPFLILADRLYSIADLLCWQVIYEIYRCACPHLETLRPLLYIHALETRFTRFCLRHLFQSSLAISLSRTTRRLRKLIVGFYRSESCCEEILVPVKIASSDREIINTKTIVLYPTQHSG